MTSLPPILRNSALAVPFTVGLGAAFGGDEAMAAGLTGLIVVANLGALAFAGPKVVHLLAHEGRTGLWGPALILKTALMLGLTLQLAQWLPPLGVGLGLSSMMFGAFLTALTVPSYEV